MLTFFIFLVLAFSSPEVSYGELAGDAEYPHMVSLYYSNMDRESTDFNRISHYCSGSLINNITVLTARHCIFVSGSNKKSDNWNNPKYYFFAQVGANKKVPQYADKKFFKSFEGTTRKVTRLYVVENYWNLTDDKLQWPDLILLELDQPIEETDRIRYMDLGDEDCPLYSSTEDFADMAGFGRKEGSKRIGKDNDYLRCARNIMINQSACDKQFIEFRKYEEWLCTYDLNYRKLCPGDSGSPLQKVFNRFDKRWTGVGVASGSSVSGCSKNNGIVSYYQSLQFYTNQIWSIVQKPPPPSTDLGPLPFLEDRYIPWYCFNAIHFQEEKVCSGFGNCTKTDLCECLSQHEGRECEFLMENPTFSQENEQDQGSLFVSFVSILMLIFAISIPLGCVLCVVFYLISKKLWRREERKVAAPSRKHSTRLQSSSEVTTSNESDSSFSNTDEFSSSEFSSSSIGSQTSEFSTSSESDSSSSYYSQTDDFSLSE